MSRTTILLRYKHIVMIFNADGPREGLEITIKPAVKRGLRTDKYYLQKHGEEQQY
jgi:hypothetical protein